MNHFAFSFGFFFLPRLFVDECDVYLLIRLHVRSGTARDPSWYNGGNDGCDPSDPVQLGAWTHVAFTHGGRGMNVKQPLFLQSSSSSLFILFLYFLFLTFLIIHPASFIL
jgi:hypothetical protein